MPSAKASTAISTPCAVWGMTSSCGAGAAAATGWPAAPLSFLSSSCWWTPYRPARLCRHAPAVNSSINWKPSAPTTRAPSCSVRCTWMAAPKATATPCFTASMRCTAPSMRAEWCGSATRTAAPAPSARGSWHGKTAATTLSLIRTRKSLRASATTAWTACLP